MIPVLGAEHSFPPPHLALKEPDGLLAMGGDLSPERLLAAYRQGIFPWFEKEPILWWCPNPRAVLFLEQFHLSHSLSKILRQSIFTVRFDTNFGNVIEACAAPRSPTQDRSHTWITSSMQEAYKKLYELGYAHSVEIYQGEELVGGLYGISLGRAFFGESMFSRVPSASKVALYYLVEKLKKWQFEFIDCQVWSPHLGSLGATLLPRDKFLEKLAISNQYESKVGKWGP